MADPLVCYYASDNVVSSTNQYFPCGSSDIEGASAQPCCNTGDYCMEDSICHYTRHGVVNGTGYYMGGCTDPTWQDPACPKQCASGFKPDIIYDRSRATWRCCDSTEDTLDCQSPTELVVKAPDPDELSTITQVTTADPSGTLTTSVTDIFSTTAKSSSTTAKATSTSLNITPTSSPSSHPDDSTDFSAGAKAGIGIAVIAVIALVLGAFFWYRIRTPKPSNLSTKKHKSEESRHISMPKNSYRPSGAFKPLSSHPPSTLPSPSVSSQGFPHEEWRESGFPLSPPARSFQDTRRESEFPISLYESETVGSKNGKRFSYEHDVGPYEMASSMVQKRVPYERPLSAQELEGSGVEVQELDAHPRERDS